MRIGIYNRWLPSLGGGERHSLAIASHLARDHDVEYISHVPLDPAQVASRLDMNLDDIGLRAVPSRSPAELSALMSGYDLFVNASNGDFIPPAARRNAMLVFFPARPQARLLQRLRIALATTARELGMQIRSVEGVYGSEQHAGAEVFALEPRAQFVLPASPFRPQRMNFALQSVSPGISGAEIQLDGVPLASVNLARGEGFVPVTAMAPPGGDRILTIEAMGDVPSQGIVLRITPIRIGSVRRSLYDYAFTRRWPDIDTRMRNLLPLNLTQIAGTYNLLWANSRYTQRWIRAYWGLPSTVLYPPVDVRMYAPGSKRARILSVGRFFAGNHNKKHLAMVEAFRRLMDDGLTGWELHLAGGTTPGEQHREYLNSVRFAARGLPITIDTDVPQDSLLELYATSSLYWHAAGLDESPTHRPEKFEHFGISVVEAMAAGCVPIVVGQGGVTELVRHGCDGYLWYTTGELQTHTRRLAKESELRSRMAQAAIVSSRKFSTASFDSSLRESLASLME